VGNGRLGVPVPFRSFFPDPLEVTSGSVAAPVPFRAFVPLPEAVSNGRLAEPDPSFVVETTGTKLPLSGGR
jgi:hypothetical protein